MEREACHLAGSRPPTLLREKDCDQKVFSERLPGVGAQARRTDRLSSALADIAFALGGEAGSRMAHNVGMLTSPDTLLRLLKAEPLPEGDPPKHLGIDDWAIRKRELYGTILVNLDTHRPVDLLPGRDLDGVRRWLEEHPGVEVISRDRAGAYAEAARLGAPDAVQVADRWHLARNLGDALERLALRHYREVRKLLQSEAEAKEQAARPFVQLPPHGIPLTRRQPEAREARYARKERLVEEARRLHDSGVSLRETARRLGLSRKTARKYVQVGVVPYVRRPRPSQLDPYEPYLLLRWGEGCHNAAQLLREIKAQGYPGSRTVLSIWLRQFRPSLPPPVRRRRHMPGARSIAWALTAPSLPASLQAAVDGIADLQQARQLSMAFLSMLRERSGDELDGWMTSTEQTDIRELKDFAAGLRRDMDAVRAGLSLPWSQGPVESHVHRLKLLKRQMYGRCSFETLRRRVLRVG